MCIRLGTRQLLTHWHYTWPHGTGMSTLCSNATPPISHTPRSSAERQKRKRERESVCVCCLQPMSIKHITYCYVRLLAKKKWRLDWERKSKKYSFLFFKPTFSLFFPVHIHSRCRGLWISFLSSPFCFFSKHNSFLTFPILRRLRFFGTFWMAIFWYTRHNPQQYQRVVCCAHAAPQLLRAQDISYDSSPLSPLAEF